MSNSYRSRFSANATPLLRHSLDDDLSMHAHHLVHEMRADKCIRPRAGGRDSNIGRMAVGEFAASVLHPGHVLWRDLRSGEELRRAEVVPFRTIVDEMQLVRRPHLQIEAGGREGIIGQ